MILQKTTRYEPSMHMPPGRPAQILAGEANGIKRGPETARHI